MAPIKIFEVRKTKRKSKKNQPKRSQHVVKTKRKSSSNSALAPYVNTLNDPFDYPPIKLGYGTYGNTVLAAAYIHTTYDANADGTIGIALSPQLTNMIRYNNGGAASVTWNTVNATNLAALQAQGSACRIVSGGIRVCPLVPSTVAPGISYCMALNGAVNNFQSASITLASAFPGMHTGIATYGATVHIFPTSDSFVTMDGSIFTAFGTSTQPYQNNGLIIFTGLPASTKCLVEAVINIEILVSGVSSSGLIGNSEKSAAAKDISDVYPTPGMLLKAAAPFLEPVASSRFDEQAKILGAGKNARAAIANFGVMSNSTFMRQLDVNNDRENRYPTPLDIRTNFADSKDATSDVVTNDPDFDHLKELTDAQFNPPTEGYGAILARAGISAAGMLAGYHWSKGQMLDNQGAPAPDNIMNAVFGNLHGPQHGA